jgi:membrane associated rhomboid family serine protease
MLVGLNAAVFVVMVLSGVSPSRPTTLSLVRWGAEFGPLTTSGEWWRMLTNTFIHIGIIHIAMNMYGLWQVGFLVERLLGNGRFLVTYLLAGLAGSYASLVVHPDVVSAGASGAIFGVFGALVGYLARHRGSIPKPMLKGLVNRSLTFVVLNLVLGLQIRGIDLAAHGGGFACGVLCALLLARPLTGTPATELARGGTDGRGQGRPLDWRGPLLALVVGLVILAGLCALLPRAVDGAFPGAV